MTTAFHVIYLIRYEWLVAIKGTISVLSIHHVNKALLQPYQTVTITLNGSHTLQQRIQFSIFFEFYDTTHGPIVTTSDKFTSDPDSRDRSSPKLFRHLSPQGFSVRDLVYLDDRVFCVFGIEDGLGLDTEGSFYETQH